MLISTLVLSLLCACTGGVITLLYVCYETKQRLHFDAYDDALHAFREDIGRLETGAASITQIEELSGKVSRLQRDIDDLYNFGIRNRSTVIAESVVKSYAPKIITEAVEAVKATRKRSIRK